jgi:hypothetical protein
VGEAVGDSRRQHIWRRRLAKDGRGRFPSGHDPTLATLNGQTDGKSQRLRPMREPFDTQQAGTKYKYDGDPIATTKPEAIRRQS